jgi:hypothetical protein
MKRQKQAKKCVALFGKPHLVNQRPKKDYVMEFLRPSKKGLTMRFFSLFSLVKSFSSHNVSYALLTVETLK